MESLLSKIEQDLKTEFDKTKRVLSFEDYLALVQESPKRHLRGSAQYLKDMFDHYGTEPAPGGARRFRLFDMQFSGDPLDQRHRVIGQHEAQQEIYQGLQTFVREGINNKLLLLHGPNGSAKSSLVNAMMRGLEDYSQSHDGALYKINWVFPVERLIKGGLGLGSYTGTKTNLQSYAHLGEEDVAAHLSCEMKDHPLLVLPVAARQELFNSLFGKNHGDRKNGARRDAAQDGTHASAVALADVLVRGNLCHKCKMIYEALFTSYKGDLKKVLLHVQVERFYISKRYRTAAVTIEPQMHVDAQSRQITMDKSLGFLPTSLQSLSLHELSGDLVDGNRGLIEFSDLLKRPVDAFKYLLGACESGGVAVGSNNVFLDSVLIGSTNELQLDAFKEFPDFTSFKARIHLIRVPYLTEYSQEKRIYEINVQKYAGDKHITPHTTSVCALWATLTRLKKPNAMHYAPGLSTVVGSLTPLEKAKLYDHGGLPSQLSPEERKLLKAAIPKLKDEYSSVPYYEGRMGASPREIKVILHDAAQNNEFTCLSPIAVLTEIEEFIKRRVMEYDFLKQDVKDGYHDSQEFIQIAKRELVGFLDKEVRESMGIFESQQYEDFLKKYILHISHALKKEKLKNTATGNLEPPDVQLMEEFEQIVDAPAGTQERETFRNNIISTIGAYSLDHPNQPVNYRLVFPDYMQKLEDHYFKQHKSQMKLLSDAIQFLGTEKEDRTSDSTGLARRTISNMIDRHGYCESCAKQSILSLIKIKY